MSEERPSQSEIKTRPLNTRSSLSSLEYLKEFGDGEIFLRIGASAALNDLLSSPLCSDEIMDQMEEMRREI